MKQDWLQIINHFGLEEQIKHWYTEVRELSQAIDKFDGSEESRKNICSELADNFNFLGQFMVFFEIDERDVIIEKHYKNKRTLKIIGGKNENINK